MNYEEEQSGEFEALESIYGEDLEIISENPPRTFTLPIQTPDYESDTGNGMKVVVKFSHTPKYPDELPLMEIEEAENIDDQVQTELLSHLTEILSDSLGMVMVFTAVSEGIDWLTNKHEEMTEAKAEAVRIQKEKDEEEERKKLEGTKVTIESFLKWKADFDEERLLMKKKEKKDGDNSKLNGRELFISNSKLQDSDLQFFAQAGETAVTVDESLFEDLDDLDLEDDDEDDEDWKPGNESD